MESASVIIDPGTYLTRAGFAKEDSPRVTFRSIVEDSTSEDRCVGEELYRKYDSNTLSRPVFDRGDVSKWEDFELLLGHCFRELDLSDEQLSERHIFVNHRSLIPKNTIDRIFMCIFETYGAKSLMTNNAQVMSLYRSGVTTGTSVFWGEGMNVSVPIYEGYFLPHATYVTKIGAMDVRSRLNNLLLRKTGKEFHPSSIRLHSEILRDIIESYSFVDSSSLSSSDYNTQTYELPCGSSLFLDKEILSSPSTQTFFENELPLITSYYSKPVNSKLKVKGFSPLVNSSIMKCDIDIRAELYKNIIISGGTAATWNLRERLESEISSLASTEMDVKIQVAPEPSTSAFVGASFMNMFMEPSHETSYRNYCTREEYDDCGAMAYRPRRFF